MVVEKETKRPAAIISDQALQCQPEYEVLSYPATVQIGSNAIVERGEYLFYENTPEELYVVISDGQPFFEMCRVSLEGEDEHISYDGSKIRKYPNNKYVGDLEDYGLVRLV